MTKVTPPGALNLYEVINYDRRESLIALVPDDLIRLVTRLGSPRPAPISHWGSKEAFVVELLAAAMPVADTDSFLENYLKKVRWHGWKTLVWRG
jgi:hypothetical protein